MSSGRGRPEASRGGGGESGGGGGGGEGGAGGKKAISFAPGLGSPRGRRVEEGYVYYKIYIVYLYLNIYIYSMYIYV